MHVLQLALTLPPPCLSPRTRYTGAAFRAIMESAVVDVPVDDTAAAAAPPADESTGIQGGAVAGIVIGCIVGTMLIVGGAFYALRRSRRSLSSITPTSHGDVEAAPPAANASAQHQQRPQQPQPQAVAAASAPAAPTPATEAAPSSGAGPSRPTVAEPAAGLPVQDEQPRASASAVPPASIDPNSWPAIAASAPAQQQQQ